MLPYFWLPIVGLLAVCCVASEEYEVDDNIAILTAEYRKTQGTQSYVTYLLTIVLVAAIGIASVYYVRFTWKERMEQKVQNLRENITTYAVISRQAHQEEVASLRKKHNAELSDVKNENKRRIDDLTNEKQSCESKLLYVNRELERCQQELLAAKDEKQRLIGVNNEVNNKKDIKIHQLKAALEEQKAENYCIHSNASFWENRAKDIELAMEAMKHRNANLQREINDLKTLRAGQGLSQRFYSSASRHPVEATAMKHDRKST